MPSPESRPWERLPSPAWALRPHRARAAGPPRALGIVEAPLADAFRDGDPGAAQMASGVGRAGAAVRGPLHVGVPTVAGQAQGEARLRGVVAAGARGAVRSAGVQGRALGAGHALAQGDVEAVAVDRALEGPVRDKGLPQRAVGLEPGARGLCVRDADGDRGTAGPKLSLRSPLVLTGCPFCMAIGHRVEHDQQVSTPRKKASPSCQTCLAWQMLAASHALPAAITLGPSSGSRTKD